MIATPPPAPTAGAYVLTLPWGHQLAGDAARRVMAAALAAAADAGLCAMLELEPLGDLVELARPPG